jgi:hypothetical protein
MAFELLAIRKGIQDREQNKSLRMGRLYGKNNEVICLTKTVQKEKEIRWKSNS